MGSVVVVGSGMFVSGRGTQSFGTVLPAVAGIVRSGELDEVCVVVRSEESKSRLAFDLDRLRNRLGWQFNPRIAIATSASDLPVVLESTADVIGCIICTPDASHLEYGISCLRSRVPTLMVKPLATSGQEARVLTETAEDFGVYAAVEFHKRLDPANRRLRLAFADGLLGPWHTGIVEYSQRRSVPLEIFGDWIAETNVYNYLGVHYADIVRFATGGKPVRVAAHGQYGFLADRGFAVHDTLQVLAEYELPNQRQPFQLFMQLGWSDPPVSSAISYQRIQVVGREGRIDSDQKYRGHQEVTAAGLDDLNLYFTQPFLNPEGTVEFNGYGVASVQQFVRDCALLSRGEVTYNTLKKCRPTFREASFATAVGDAVTQSAALSGEWIDVETEWIVGGPR